MQYSKCSIGAVQQVLNWCSTASAARDVDLLALERTCEDLWALKETNRSGCTHMQRSTKGTSRIFCTSNLTILTGHGCVGDEVLLAGSAAPRGGDPDASFVVDNAYLSDLLGRWMGR
jgi:hypothetical protein